MCEFFSKFIENPKEHPKEILIIGPFVGEFFYDVLFFNPGARYKVNFILDSFNNQNQKIIPWYVGMENRFFLYKDFIDSNHKTFLPEKFNKSSNQFKTRNRLLKRPGFNGFINKYEKLVQTQVAELYKIDKKNVNILFSIDQTQFFDKYDRPLIDIFKRKFCSPKPSNLILQEHKDFYLDILFFIPEEPTMFSSISDSKIFKKFFYKFIEDFPELKVGFYGSKSDFFLSTSNVNIDFYENFEKIENIYKLDIILFLLYNSKMIFLPTSEWNLILNQKKIPYVSFGNSKFFTQYHFGNLNGQNLVISDTLKSDKIYDMYVKPFFQLMWRKLNANF